MSREHDLRTHMTDAERRLWSALRGRRLRGFKFRRQHRLGPFIADFVCIEHRLVIEADGGQHAESIRDARRTEWLERRGWRVLRFWNNDILANTEGVQEAILRVLSGTADERIRPAPQAAPLPPAGEEGAHAKRGKVRGRRGMT